MNDKFWKCCLNLQSMYQSMNGFVRAVTYYMDMFTHKPQSMRSLYEGSVTNALPNGFGRYIDSKYTTLFIGYSTTAPTSSVYFSSYYTLHGTAIYFKDFKLKYIGWYIDD